MSTLTRKSLRDLSRHRFRSILAVITIAATVMGLWLLAVPRGFDAAMSGRAEADRLHHLRLSPENFAAADAGGSALSGRGLDETTLDALRNLGNVSAVEVRPAMYTSVRAGGRTQDAWLVGVEDFSRQQVNVVHLDSGVVPVPYRSVGEALTDTANSATGRYTGTSGDEIEIRAGDGNFYPFTITGAGGTLGWSAAMDGPAVFFVPAETVRLFLGGTGFNSIEILLEDASIEAANDTLQEVRGRIAEAAPGLGFWRSAEVRDPGSWPGRDNVVNLLPLLYVVVAVAVLAAVILVGTTMNTIVREQTGEIGILKALGARRGAIIRSYLISVSILGGAGVLVGTGTGIVVGNVLAGAIQQELLGFDPGWRVDPLVAAAGLVVGGGGSLLAAGPALRKATRMSVHSALNGHGTEAVEGRLAGRIGRGRFRLSSLATLGLRNVGRRGGRSLAASSQVALGAAVALALGAFAVTAITITNETMSQEGSDIQVYARRGQLPPWVPQVLEGVEGVAAVQPIVYANVGFSGEDRAARGLPAQPVYQPNLTAGRWFTEAEVDAEARVVVVGEPLANVAGVAIGDRVDIDVKGSVEIFEVVGVDSTLVNEGKYVLFPLSTLMDLSGVRGPTAYWVQTVSPDPEVVDRTVAALDSGLRARGYFAEVVARYPQIRSAQAEDRVVVGVIQMLGLPILGIGMIGLVGAMASNVVERRREIGVLRAVGARKRHLRRIFRAEGMAIVGLGWLFALPVGYGLAWLITRQFANALQIDLDLLFPVWLPIAVLGGVIVVAAVSMRLPLRTVVKMAPGEAIRYE
jgi:putative ABC transport system permease protein